MNKIRNQQVGTWAWPRNPSVGKLKVIQSKQTRRMKRLAYRAAKTLRRIEKLLARQAAIAANLETRGQVKTLKALKRIPHLRVRSTEAINESACADPVTYYRNPLGVITSVGKWPLSVVARWGMRKAITDFRPIARLDPPRNVTTIGSFRTNSLQASIELYPAILGRAIHIMPMSKWPYKGLQNHGILSTLPQPIVFDLANANKALQKAIAKVYEADIQANEYIVEWKQVIRLLRDPLRTILSCHKVLEKWTRRNNWMWIPQRNYRNFNKGTLVSKVPTGGVLMSMRTREEISPAGVSAEVLQAACNRWLQYRYGIAPMVSDITKVMDLWLRPVAPPALKSKSARHWVSRPAKVESTYEVRLGPWDTSYKRVKTTGDFYAAKVWYTVDENAVPTSYTYGMHPSQWLNVIWNATPWSFVADWVINLDEWMTSQRSVPWIKLQANVVTHKTFENFRSTCISAKDFQYGASGVIKGSPIATVHRESINRKVDLPRTTEPFLSSAWSSVKNAMTGAALILQPILADRTSFKPIVKGK